MDYELIKRILDKPGIIEEADLIVLKKAAKFLTDTVELHSAVSLKREICANLAAEYGLKDIKFFRTDNDEKCPTVQDLGNLYDVLISHFKRESKPLEPFKDTPNDLETLVSTRHITDSRDVYDLVRARNFNSIFPIPYNMYNRLAHMNLAPGDKIYITHVDFAYPLKLTVIRSHMDYVNVRRDS